MLRVHGQHQLPHWRLLPIQARVGPGGTGPGEDAICTNLGPARFPLADARDVGTQDAGGMLLNDTASCASANSINVGKDGNCSYSTLHEFFKGVRTRLTRVGPTAHPASRRDDELNLCPSSGRHRYRRVL